MKNVLIIASYWPYRQGSKRVPGLVKFLPELGWQPIILTPPLKEKPTTPVEVIETNYHDTIWKKLLRVSTHEDARTITKKRFNVNSGRSWVDVLFNLGGMIVNYPDSYKGWESAAFKAGSKLLNSNNIDALLSIWPVTSHLVASKLKTKYNVRWVADFPDLWSQNAYYAYGHIRKLLDKRLELKTMKNADTLTTTSQPWSDKLASLYEGKPVHSITHGFDPEHTNVPPAKLTAKFTITYTGMFYPKRSSPAMLFNALRDLITNGTLNPEDIEVRLYGLHENWLNYEIEQHKLTNIVKQYGTVTHETALERQRESQLLLLADWNDPKEKGVYTGKIFEYLGARRPILATGGVTNNVVDVLLRETKTGVHTLTVKDTENALKEFYRQYKQKDGLTYNGEEAEINKYSQREMARKFAKLLQGEE